MPNTRQPIAVADFLSRSPDHADAVEAMKRGAADYVTKPFDTAELRIKIDRLLKRDALEREVVKLRAEVEALGSDENATDRLHGLLGRSAAIQGIFETIRRVASSRATVLICGESGTGKELVARALHGLGTEVHLDRPHGPTLPGLPVPAGLGGSGAASGLGPVMRQPR